MPRSLGELMELNRPKYLRKKDIMLVCDVPVKKELEWQEPFSSASNLNLLTSLRTGMADPFNHVKLEGHIGINSTDIHTTYLDYSYYGEDDVEDNFDFKSEFKKKKDLHSLVVRGGITEYLVEKTVETVTEKSIKRHSFYKLETHKDLYISYRLKSQLDCLVKEIREVQPKIVIVVGKWSLFFLSGLVSLAQTQGNYKDRKPLGGLVTYRASIMRLHQSLGLPDTLLYPMYHTINSVTMVDKTTIMDLDLQKISHVYATSKEKGIEYYMVPDKKYQASIDKVAILEFMDSIYSRVQAKPTLVAIDIETMFGSIIDCIGLAVDIDNGLCIPFASVSTPYIWSVEDEAEIMYKLYLIMSHKNCLHIGQNYSYDCQFYYTIWGMVFSATKDTMGISHTLYNYMPKDLAFLASIYCEHYIYWKGEVKASEDSPETRWKYNAKDCMYTLEVYLVLQDILDYAPEKLQQFYEFQQLEVAPALDVIMNRGVRIDVEEKERLYKFFKELMDTVYKRLQGILGVEWNLNSPPQKKKVFKDLLGMTLITKKGGAETTEAAAMRDYIEEYPMYAGFLTLLLEYQSLKVFVSNFLAMKLDRDNRARTQYKQFFTDTLRLSSVKNVYGTGGNFQNIPERGKIELKYIEQVLRERDGGDTVRPIQLPNCKKIFIPDEGYTFFNVDLKGADAQIVAFDSDCQFLIDIFQDPTQDLYAVMASEYYGRKIEKASPERTQFKAVAHATAYLGQAMTIARAAGLLVHEVDQVQRWYFERCPEVKSWQQSIINDINTKGHTTNIFGARGWYLNKLDHNLTNKAVAWRGQSVIAILCNKGLVAATKIDTRIEPLLQIHDAVAGQFKTDFLEAPKLIREAMLLRLPYNTPLTIDVDFDIYSAGYGSKKLKEHNYIM